LEDAKVNASDIDYVNAHASGTPMNDANELQHIRWSWAKAFPSLAPSLTPATRWGPLGLRVRRVPSRHAE